MCTCGAVRYSTARVCSSSQSPIFLPGIFSLLLQGVAVCSALLLSALSTIDLKVREKEETQLAGVDFDEVLVPMSADSEKSLRWAAGAISRACPNAKSGLAAPPFHILNTPSVCRETIPINDICINMKRYTVDSRAKRARAPDCTYKHYTFAAKRFKAQ
jgi:hypothetical protein